jgi:4-diphosphocytidyl-2-C-methyl-D-erythritol kinase
MSVLRALAPAKVNLGLFLGPPRAGDGKHELVSVMQSISLADELTLSPAPAGATDDEVACPGVPGPPAANLAASALRAFRASTGWDAPPVRLEIVKRIPVAAGLGGGSADAAAALRLAQHASGLGDAQLLRRLAAELGADVPAQISPGRWLASGAGEELEELSPPGSIFGVLVLPLAAPLSTAAVYAEADRLELARAPQLLAERRRELSSAFAHGAPLPAASELLHNDLQRAAVSLCPDIAQALSEAHAAGGDPALLSGSGPTVLGLFAGDGRLGVDGRLQAERAAAKLRGRVPAAMWATPVDAAYGRVRDVDPQDLDAQPA